MFSSAAKGFGRLFNLIFGLIFLVVGLIFFLSYDPEAYDRSTTATITRIEEEYSTASEEWEHRVYIDYTAGGQEFHDADYFAYNSKMKVGDRVEIYYMSSDPSQIAASDHARWDLFGLGAAVLGAAFVVLEIRRIILKK